MNLNNGTKLSNSEIKNILINCLEINEHIEIYDDMGNKLTISDLWDNGKNTCIELSPRR